MARGAGSRERKSRLRARSVAGPKVNARHPTGSLQVGSETMQDIIREKLTEMIAAIHQDIKADNPGLSLGELAVISAEEVVKEANAMLHDMKRRK
jgi:hypothetical protein